MNGVVNGVAIGLAAEIPQRNMSTPEAHVFVPRARVYFPDVNPPHQRHMHTPQEETCLSQKRIWHEAGGSANALLISKFRLQGESVLMNSTCRLKDEISQHSSSGIVSFRAHSRKPQKRTHAEDYYNGRASMES